MYNRFTLSCLAATYTYKQLQLGQNIRLKRIVIRSNAISSNNERFHLCLGNVTTAYNVQPLILAVFTGTAFPLEPNYSLDNLSVKDGKITYVHYTTGVASVVEVTIWYEVDTS